MNGAWKTLRKGEDTNMSEKMVMLREQLGNVISPEAIEKLGSLIPDQVPAAGVVPIMASIVKRLPQGLSDDEILGAVKKQMAGKAKDNQAQAKENPGSVRALTRKYYDSLLIEMRLMGAVEPDTGMDLFGCHFNSPIMTGAMSHMSHYVKGEPGPMEFLAQGAKNAGCVHWVGMVDNDHFAQVMEMGAKTIRVVKPYADDSRILEDIRVAEELGCIAVAMDIDHVLTSTGENDIAMGNEMKQKTLEQMASYAQATSLPFIVKGVLSVHDALRAKEIGAAGVMVSHHGGRLAYLVPPAVVLPRIKEAVGDSMHVFADCGIASGMDAYKALALGAEAVGVGTHLAAIARADGAEGVDKRLNEMRGELKGAMYFTGVKDCGSFDPTVLYHRTF